MSEIRDGVAVYQEQVAIAREAVNKAMATNSAQQQQAGAWLDGGLPAGEAHAPGAGNAPNH